MDIIDATKLKEIGLIQVHSSYKIVEKDETRVLIKIMDECGKIHNAFQVMSFPTQGDIIEEGKMIQMLNHQIQRKLYKLYRYYHRHFGLTFDDGDWEDLSELYKIPKATEDNIALICETVRSWEESTENWG